MSFWLVGGGVGFEDMMTVKAQARPITPLVDRAGRVVNCVGIGVGEIAKM